MFRAPLQEDPFYTFPWFVEQRNELKAAIGKDRCESLFFIKSGGSSVYDKPHYKLYSKDLKELLLFCKTKEYGLDCIPVTTPVELRHSSQRKKICWKDKPENPSLAIGIIIWPHANQKIWHGWKKQELQTISR